MTQLMTLDGIVLSEIVTDVSPISFEATQVINKTLDGSVHIQVIGDAIQLIEFELLASKAMAEHINTLESLGTRFKLRKNDSEYIGLLTASPSWSKINREIYKTKLKISILEASS